MNNLQIAIIRTVVFFDIFDYPLTLMEIWKWLYVTDGSQIARKYLADIENELTQITDKIEAKNGLYFLRGREQIIRTRLERYGLAEDKYRKAVRFIKILRLIPFVKLVAVCNNLSYSNSSAASDIDLFIIAEKNRIFSARFWVIGVLKLFGVRPAAESKRDTIDATFFISEDELDIENLRLKIEDQRSKTEDIYLTYWAEQLVPVYDPFNLYQKFQSANGRLKNYLPNAIGYELNRRRQVKRSWGVRLVNLFISLLFDWPFWEKVFKNYQLKIMPRLLKEMMNKDSRVVVNDKILKFHQTDRREEYRDKFNYLVNRLID
jgi:hypothetical protein